MKDTYIETFKEEDCNKEKTFWQIPTLILVGTSLGIPMFFIMGNLLLNFGILEYLGKEFNFGLSLGNSIALLSAGMAIIGILYSNHKNELRSEKQICEAGNRLARQINNQNINLNVQLEKQDERLVKQLEAQEKNVETQLYFNREQESMLDLYNILYDNRKSIYNEINNITTETNPNNFNKVWNEELQKIISERDEIYTELTKYQRNIHKFHYATEESKEKIIKFVFYIYENKKNYESYEYIRKNVDIKRKIYFDDENNECEKLLIDIYKILENYIKVPFNRASNNTYLSDKNN